MHALAAILSSLLLSTPAAAVTDPIKLPMAWGPTWSADRLAKAGGTWTIVGRQTDDPERPDISTRAKGKLWDLDKGRLCGYVQFQVTPETVVYTGKWRTIKSYRTCGNGYKRIDFTLRKIDEARFRVCQISEYGKRPVKCSPWAAPRFTS